MRALLASELRQRMRSRRWWVLVALWTVSLFLIMIPIRMAGQRSQSFYRRVEDIDLGPLMFGSLALLVLGLSCLVIPSLTAMAVNGERDRGTLAVLQASLLRPRDIVFAKFFAALLTAGVFLAATLPIALWCYLEGGVSIVRALTVYLVLFVVAGVFIALALAASSLVRRPAMSALLSYGLVGLLTIGTGILFALADATAPRQGPYGTPERGARWVLLAPNPFVVLADAAPRSNPRLDDPLESIQQSIRSLRDPQPQFFDGGPREFREFRRLQRRQPDPPPVWPAGLVIELSLAAGALYITMRRLRVPVRKLAPGHRVA